MNSQSMEDQRTEQDLNILSAPLTILSEQTKTAESKKKKKKRGIDQPKIQDEEVKAENDVQTLQNNTDSGVTNELILSGSHSQAIAADVGNKTEPQSMEDHSATSFPILQTLASATANVQWRMPLNSDIIIDTLDVSTANDGPFNSIWNIFRFVLSMVISILELCFGAKFLNNCPIDRHIPIYLLISGISGASLLVLNGIFSTVYAKVAKHSANYRIVKYCCSIFTWNALLITLTVFYLIWFILGTVWIAAAKTHVQFSNRFNNSETYCDRVLFNFAISMIVIKWFAPAFSSLVACCIFVCFGPRL